MADRTEFLATTELFRDVPRGVLPHLDAELDELVIPAGSVLFRRGDVGNAVYLVVSGELTLEVGAVTVLTRKRGECIGEFALIDDEPRSADAVAQTDVKLLRWGRSDFERAVGRDPGVARGIFRMLTAKLREDVETKVRLHVERERWQQDLARAREIQLGMLPEDQPELQGASVAGYCNPAAEVGGDYYDVLPFEQGRIGLVIGDVTGHGFYSGLFVAIAKSCLHTQARFDHTPEPMMDAMRRALALSIRRRLLMTCCYVLLDPAAGRLRYANAGHPYPYLHRDGALERLEAIDPILGALEVDAGGFGAAELEWRPGDVLVMYSDGVTEARNAIGQMFEGERLESCIREHAHLSAAEIRNAILGDVADYASGFDQADDATLVVCKAT